ncbi:carbohydrate ABC transporter permease [Anaerocolumna xylanovorans]|uniref:Lactose/L-arabinose transport system permease protein n=1 Tax=Anaerocolumna xylanovorans DSM 12503 TaxID=1121345 RepID=A0A1M7Y5A7_9FIRM|nr:sugar ABC transporter permease [Anaerocolumna xylanovorans]SHO47644.1 lactose/L-arabinose transport system permease protein [Anaerocolumna xylanovorans DSM 12503]
MQNNKKGLTLSRKHNLIGWGFLLPATLLIVFMSFYPGIQGFLLSLQVGHGMQLTFGGLKNYVRILKDPVFKEVFFNTFFYLIIQVPIMLVLALILASMLNNKHLRCKAIFRTAIFLPCATSLVSYSMIFRSLFTTDGLVNNIIRSFGMPSVNWFGNEWTARGVIIIALIWRWTGYNMVFYLAGLQNIEYSVYEAAKIDGASPAQSLFRITIPLLKPTILLTAIMSTNGTLQLFDESVNLTSGGPGRATMTLSHYIYNTSFTNNPNFGYSAAMSFVIMVIVAILAFVQMKVGDKR